MIIVYDVSVKRVSKVCHFLRRYLNWIQNSVFEGDLTRSELKRVEMELRNILNLNEDSVVIYILHSKGALRRKYIGIKKAEPSTVI